VTPVRTNNSAVKMKTNHGQSRAGFTLVEISIVMALIGLMAAIAIPNFMRARDTARLNVIYNNLRILNGAKEQWAMQQNKGNGASVGNVSTLSAYFRSGELQQVINETYLPNPVGTPPVAALPAGASLGGYAAGSEIPAP
jgi:prepilin-type N-terminal cleavage/methylation domain-containing protein